MLLGWRYRKLLFLGYFTTKSDKLSHEGSLNCLLGRLCARFLYFSKCASKRAPPSGDYDGVFLGYFSTKFDELLFGGSLNNPLGRFCARFLDFANCASKRVSLSADFDDLFLGYEWAKIDGLSHGGTMNQGLVCVQFLDFAKDASKMAPFSVEYGRLISWLWMKQNWRVFTCCYIEQSSRRPEAQLLGFLKCASARTPSTGRIWWRISRLWVSLIWLAWT